MGPRHKPLGHFLGHQKRADGQTICQRFGQRNDIRLKIKVFIGEQFPGAPQAHLNLVQHQQQLMLVAQTPQPRQVLRIGNLYPSFPLDGLHQDGAGLIINGHLHGRQIIEGHKSEAGQQRLKPLPEFLLPGGR